MVPFPDKQYQIIYADPPWSYRDKALAGRRGACCKYPVMSTAEIASMPVENIAADDCALFLWATFPKLPDALEVMRAWGFAYKTVAFVWIKQTFKRRLFWGMGHWTRANAEICIFGTRGKPARVNRGVHQVITASVREHSRKPDETRERILKLCGDLPRIELFARNKFELFDEQTFAGWDLWGNQAT